MLTPRLSRSWIADISYALVFFVGVCMRVRHILYINDPRSFIHGNAKLYIELAKRFATPGFEAGAIDVAVPPGTPVLFSLLYVRDPTLTLAVWAMLVLTIFVPVVVGGLGWVTFGKTSGKMAMAISSVYFPFIDYGGHFLSEIPFTILLTLTMLLFFVAIRSRSIAAMLGWSLAAGIAGSLAIAFKIVALPAMVCLVTIYVLFSRSQGKRFGEPGLARAAARKLRMFTALAFFVGVFPLTAALSLRCTRASAGQMCFVCSKGPADFLLGHYGRLQSMAWKGDSLQFAGSDSANQHGYRARPVMQFDLTDGPANSAAAWGWIRAHPGEALVLSCEHVYDLFVGSFPTPGIHTSSWMLMEASHFAFLLLLLLPSVLLAFDRIKTCGLWRFLGSTEFLLGTPIFGLAVAAFITTGEARYRIPFDPIFIVLAIQFYRRCGTDRGARLGRPSPASSAPGGA